MVMEATQTHASLAIKTIDNTIWNASALQHIHLRVPEKYANVVVPTHLAQIPNP